MEREARQARVLQARQARQEQREQQEQREPERQQEDEQQGKSGKSSESIQTASLYYRLGALLARCARSPAAWRGDRFACFPAVSLRALRADLCKDLKNMEAETLEISRTTKQKARSGQD